MDACNAGDFSRALRFAETALTLSSSPVAILPDYAVCLMRDKQYEASYRAFKLLYRISQSQKPEQRRWLKGLAEVCGWLGKSDEVQRYGYEALINDDLLTRSSKIYSYPGSPPAAFNKNTPDENIVVFSLYGCEPRYCEGAVLNAQAALSLLPGWRCRFYVDKNVPRHVTDRLEALHAQVVRMEMDNCSMNPMMWRYLVIGEPKINRFLFRDADSLLSERDCAAVHEWTGSEFWFHHMRDYFSHTDLLMGGLWGGCNGVIPDIADVMAAYSQLHGLNGRMVDQNFLGEYLWPTIRLSLLSHDDCFSFHHSKPFPPHQAVCWVQDNDFDFHVGSNASYMGKEYPCLKEDGEQQLWLIRDDNSGEVICRYASEVSGERCKIFLPFPHIKALNEERWILEFYDR